MIQIKYQYNLIKHHDVLIILLLNNSDVLIKHHKMKIRNINFFEVKKISNKSFEIRNMNGKLKYKIELYLKNIIFFNCNLFKNFN